MRISKVFLPCIIGVALSATTSAEVYKSTDAQGNTVYSDKPSQGATVVKLPPISPADPPVAIPRPLPSPETPATSEKRSNMPASSEPEETDDDRTMKEKKREEEAKQKRNSST